MLTMRQSSCTPLALVCTVVSVDGGVDSSVRAGTPVDLLTATSALPPSDNVLTYISVLPMLATLTWPPALASTVACGELRVTFSTLHCAVAPLPVLR